MVKFRVKNIQSIKSYPRLSAALLIFAWISMTITNEIHSGNTPNSHWIQPMVHLTEDNFLLTGYFLLRVSPFERWDQGASFSSWMYFSTTSQSNRKICSTKRSFFSQITPRTVVCPQIPAQMWHIDWSLSEMNLNHFPWWLCLWISRSNVLLMTSPLKQWQIFSW